MKLGGAALLVAACLLAGCDDEQQVAKQDALRHCFADARSHFPRNTDQSSDHYQTEEEYIDQSLLGPVSACMDKSGFVYSQNRPLCIGDHSDPACWDVEHPNRPWRFISHYWHYFRGDAKPSLPS